MISAATWSCEIPSVLEIKFCSADWVWRAWTSFMVFCAVAYSVWMSEMDCWPGCGVRLLLIRWLSAEACAPPLALPGGLTTTAAYTAICCRALRIACSLACAPNCTVCALSTRTVEVERAVPGPELPVYHSTVFAAPFVRLVAEDSGEPDTRSGPAVAVPLAGKPSAANAALFELVTVSDGAALLPFSVTMPLVTLEGVEVPVSASILVSSCCTVSVTLTWLLPLAPEATKVMVWPFTVMVSPAEKAVVSALPAPESVVVPLIGAAAWLLAALPTTVVVLKKLLPAATAEAATSEVLAMLPIAVLRAASRLDAVVAGVAPMAKLPLGGGVVLVAVSVTDWLVPSGRLKL